MIELSLLLAALGGGGVDVELTPSAQAAFPGCPVEVEIHLTSAAPIEIAAVDVILEWDPSELQLLLPAVSASGWFFSGFLDDPDGINDDVLDGTALYTALVDPANPIVVWGDVHVATLEFLVLDDAQVSLLPSFGTFGVTQVVGTTPGVFETGALSAPADVTMVPVLALENLRAGIPPNPMAFLPGVTSRPIVGQVWDPVVDHTTFLPTAVIDLIFLTAFGDNLDLGPPFGTLLCDIVAFQPLVYGTFPEVPFHLPVPLNCNLIGKSFCAQVLSWDGIDAGLTNAIDGLVGTF